MDKSRRLPVVARSGDRPQRGTGGGYGRTALQLLGLTALPLALQIAKMIYAGHASHVYVAWNLFLAWLPLGFAWLAVRPRATPMAVRVVAGLVWLLFLPNAPYLVTDLMHLRVSGGVPILYDVVLLFSAALCGLALGLVSLRWMQSAVRARLGVWPGRLFGLAALGAAGFGMYLGRYLRWNSWDVLIRPAALAQDIWLRVRHPVQHWQAWALVLLFATLLACVYGALNALPAAREER